MEHSGFYTACIPHTKSKWHLIGAGLTRLEYRHVGRQKFFTSQAVAFAARTGRLLGLRVVEQICTVSGNVCVRAAAAAISVLRLYRSCRTSRLLAARMRLGLAVRRIVACPVRVAPNLVSRKHAFVLPCVEMRGASRAFSSLSLASLLPKVSRACCSKNSSGNVSNVGPW